MVPVTDRGESADRSVAEALQHGAAAFKSRYLTPAAFAAKLEKQGATDAQATGRIAAVYGASAPRRRTTVPQGANERSNRGGRLKLNVVRRNRAGHNDAPVCPSPRSSGKMTDPGIAAAAMARPASAQRARCSRRSNLAASGSSKPTRYRPGI